MKNFKRKLAGFLIFAMVLGIMAPGVVAQAAGENDPPQTSMSVSASILEESMSFSGLPSSVSAIRYTDTDPAKLDKAKWEEVEVKTNKGWVNVDLSWVKKTKDVTISYQIMEDGKTEPASTGSIKFNAQPKDAYKVALITVPSGASCGGKLALKVDEGYALGSADTGYLVVYNSKTKEVVSPGTISIAKGTRPIWMYMDSHGYEGGIDVKGMNDSVVSALETMKAKGATLTFQVIPENSERTHTWLPKTTKFAYKKQANAPSVKLDLKKETLSLKTGMEYRVTAKAGATSGKWTEWQRVPENTKTMEVSKVFNETSGAAVTMSGIYGGTPTKLQVRTVKEGAIPSKIATVNIKASTMEAINAATNVGITYNVDSKKYEFTNQDKENAYEYAVVASPASIKSDTKWYAIKVAKTPGKAVASIADSKVGTNVFIIRKAAQKAVKAKETTPAKDAILASNFKTKDAAEVKTASARVVSSASISSKSPTNATANAVRVDDTKVSVTGTAISGGTVSLTVQIIAKNSADATVKVDKKAIGDSNAKVTLGTTKVGADGKIEIKIDLPDGKDGKSTNGTITVTVGKQTKFTVEVKIDPAK